MAEARAYFEDIDKEVLLEESPQKHAADNNDEPTVEEQSPLPPIQLASGRKVTREWVNSLPALEELEPINLETLVEDEGDGDGDDASTNTDEKDDVAAPLPVTRPSVAALGRRSSILLPPAMRKPSRGSLPRMSIMPSDATAAQGSTGSRGSARPRSSIVAACTSVAAERARHSSLAMPTLAEDEDAVTEPIEAVPTAVDPEEDGVADSLDTNLRALLNDCDQTGVKCEDDLPSMADVIDEFAPLPAALPVGGLGRKKKAAAAPPRLRKIGEGTFGEAFKDASGKVYKVVPMGGTVLVNGEEQKPVAELRAEAVVALRLSHLGGDGKSASYTCPFYAKTHAVRVCRGRYDDSLLAEWCRWDKENESENDRPDFFPEDQLFAVFIVADGGTDLERYRFRSYDEAIAVLFQASLALACGEGACEFEHRDLHWGNLLIAPAENELGPVMLNGAPVEIETSASCVKVTLIDFTLSRVVTPDGGVAFCDLEGDPALFDGPTGDTQADTYRRMRKAIPLETVCLMEEVEEEEEEEEDGDKTKAPKRTEMVTRRVRDWSKHVPSTNALWLHYLVDCVMNQKSGPGGLALNSEQTKVLRGFRKRSLRYESASEAVWDEAFRGLWHV